jgi:alkylated DNA nucleotide flippase Atl1
MAHRPDPCAPIDQQAVAIDVQHAAIDLVGICRLRRALTQLLTTPVGSASLPVTAVTEFQQAVVETIRRIPHGHWATYGDVARNAGRVGAARAVGQMLSPVDDLTVPTWRVLLSGGRLPSCLPSASRSADEWMAIYRRKWETERLLRPDGARARPELRIVEF